jgi:hypothetical protein
MTIEATLAPHKKARQRRLSQGHSSFSLLLLLRQSPSAVMKVEKSFSQLTLMQIKLPCRNL